ncbi:MAG: cytidine deaminase [Actinomycetota bacterium]
MTTDRLDDLIAAATHARAQAYVPYSGFAVGAALLAAGRIFAGVNIENASYPISVCAERNAIAGLVLAGERRIDAVAVVTAADDPTPPCGGCRQALWEFGHETDPLVVSVTLGGRRIERRLSELLPGAFGPGSFAPEPG